MQTYALWQEPPMGPFRITRLANNGWTDGLAHAIATAAVFQCFHPSEGALEAENAADAVFLVGIRPVGDSVFAEMQKIDFKP
ncbi:hypothetical protein [Mesorhizobium australicum]|uniref:hypothetical protein n=1 Tax=Mesorhizobium australicum TaxID=536018 RepID=UPI00333C7D4C